MRVAIASDQPIFRRGLVSLITSLPGVQLVGEALDGQEALQLCELVAPDLLCLDLGSTTSVAGRGEQIAVESRRRWPGMRVVLFQPGDPPAAADQPEGLIRLGRDVSEAGLIAALRDAPARLQGEGGGISATAADTADPLEVTRQLAQALHDSVPSYEGLSDLLDRFAPQIFPSAGVHLRLLPSRDVYNTIIADSRDAERAFRWLRNTTEPEVFSPGDTYPWGGRQPDGARLVLAPVLNGRQYLGGLCVAMPVDVLDLSTLLGRVNAVCSHLLPALNTLLSGADQTSGALAVKELEMAGKIQSDILPERAPAILGYDIAAQLEPARETSGDFYDFIPLPNGSWGIAIADVTDKGIGAALFMALSSTLIRTYASRYPTLPAFTLDVVNERILSDSRGNMFVTVFYAVLEPQLGRLRFVNAGHPPAFLISVQKGKPVDGLRRTGMALGVLEGAHWQQKVAKMNPGDMLILYTDGITEAQNAQGDFFGEQRLLEVVRLNAGKPAREVVQAVLQAVRRFAGDLTRLDDIAMVAIRRKN